MDAPAYAAPQVTNPHMPLPYFQKADGPVIPARSDAELYAILEEEDIANSDRVIAQSEPES